MSQRHVPVIQSHAQHQLKPCSEHGFDIWEQGFNLLGTWLILPEKVTDLLGTWFKLIVNMVLTYWEHYFDLLGTRLRIIGNTVLTYWEHGFYFLGLWL